MPSKLVTLGISLVISCYLSVPHPHCYYLKEKQDKAELRLYFVPNFFFANCDKGRDKNTLVETDREKTVIIYLDGDEHSILEGLKCINSPS